MTKDGVLEWMAENDRNFQVFRINREPFQLAMDSSVGTWTNADYDPALFTDVAVKIRAFAIWHNYPEPK